MTYTWALVCQRGRWRGRRWPIGFSAHYILNQLSLCFPCTWEHIGKPIGWNMGGKPRCQEREAQDFRLGAPWFILGALGHGIFKTLNLLLWDFICGHTGDGGIVPTHCLDRKAMVYDGSCCPRSFADRRWVKSGSPSELRAKLRVPFPDNKQKQWVDSLMLLRGYCLLGWCRWTWKRGRGWPEPRETTHGQTLRILFRVYTFLLSS